MIDKTPFSTMLHLINKDIWSIILGQLSIKDICAFGATCKEINAFLRFKIADHRRRNTINAVMISEKCITTVEMIHSYVSKSQRPVFVIIHGNNIIPVHIDQNMIGFYAQIINALYKCESYVPKDDVYWGLTRLIIYGDKRRDKYNREYYISNDLRFITNANEETLYELATYTATHDSNSIIYRILTRIHHVDAPLAIKIIRKLAGIETLHGAKLEELVRVDDYPTLMRYAKFLSEKNDILKSISYPEGLVRYKFPTETITAGDHTRCKTVMDAEWKAILGEYTKNISTKRLDVPFLLSDFISFADSIVVDP